MSDDQTDEAMLIKKLKMNMALGLKTTLNSK